MSESSGRPPHDASMDEILASIRRIIAEENQSRSATASDSLPGGGAEAAPLKRAEVLELTQMVDEEGKVTSLGAGSRATSSSSGRASVSESEITPSPPASEPAMPADRLVEAGSAKSAVDAFRELRALARTREEAEEPPGARMPLGDVGRTLEDVVRDELRPLLKAWLDRHLPPLVERLVHKEIRRIVRSTDDG